MARSKYRLSATMRDATTRAMILLRYPVVTIFNAGTSSPIGQTLYAGATGGTTLPNPFTGDQYGTVEFFLDAAQDVKILVDGAYEGLGTYTIDYEPTPPLVAGLVTTAGGKTIDGTLVVRPTGGVGGWGVDANGRIGLFDLAASTQDVASSLAASKTSTLNEVLMTEETLSTFLGTPVDTGGGVYPYESISVASASTTSIAGGATGTMTVTTVTVAGTPWTAHAHIGRAFVIASGTGSSPAQAAVVVENTTNTLTLNKQLTTAPDPTTVFHLRTGGDMGQHRFTFRQEAGSAGNGLGGEFHLVQKKGAAGYGAQGIEVGVHVTTPWRNTNDSIGIRLRASGTGWLTTPADAVEASAAVYAHGDPAVGIGWAYYFLGLNASDTEEIALKKGGKARFGSTTAVEANTQVAVYQTSANDVTAGLQLRQYNSAANYLTFFEGGDNKGYMHATITGLVAFLALDPSSGGATLGVNAASGHTGLLQDWLVNSVSKASIRADGLGVFTAAGVATLVKAGAPADGDWSVAPPVGTMVYDTTNHKWWIREGVATWKGVVLS